MCVIFKIVVVASVWCSIYRKMDFFSSISSRLVCVLMMVCAECTSSSCAQSGPCQNWSSYTATSDCSILETQSKRTLISCFKLLTESHARQYMRTIMYIIYNYVFIYVHIHVFVIYNLYMCKYNYMTVHLHGCSFVLSERLRGWAFTHLTRLLIAERLKLDPFSRKVSLLHHDVLIMGTSAPKLHYTARSDKTFTVMHSLHGSVRCSTDGLCV